MKVGEFVEVVNNISYRPGWKLEASWNPGYQMVQVILYALVDDAYSPGHSISVMVLERLSAEEVAGYFTEERVLDWVRRSLFMVMEEHENREWFQYRGVRVFDPHKNDPKPASLSGEQYGR